MPYGVYVAGIAGDEVSSTYEGRHLTFSESQLIHPTHADGFVDKGDPILVGENIVGVAFKDAAAATDLIAIDTEGIWQLSVLAEDEGGASAVVVGDELFINKTTAIISKIRTASTQARFGLALYPIAAGTDVIPIKLHEHPESDVEDVVYAKEITYVEEGAGTYTGSISLPTGATLVDIIVHATALWDAATSAALIVGDVADPDGYFTAVNLKATDLLAGESISFSHEGGKKGADLDTAGANHVRRRYLAGARVITGVVTSVGAGTAGRTRITVLYTKPVTSVLATFA